MSKNQVYQSNLEAIKQEIVKAKEEAKRNFRSNEDQVIDLVVNQLKEEDDFDLEVIENDDNYTLYTYHDFKEYFCEGLLHGIPKHLRKYVDVDGFILDQLKYSSCNGDGEFFVVKKTPEDEAKMLNEIEIGECFEGNYETFFRGDLKYNYYIVVFKC